MLFIYAQNLLTPSLQCLQDTFLGGEDELQRGNRGNLTILHKIC